MCKSGEMTLALQGFFAYPASKRPGKNASLHCGMQGL
jgi:hypothetical protein